MPTLTIWHKAGAVELVQLSDSLDDGTASQQIAYLSSLDYLSGYSCVSTDYHGVVPSEPFGWDGVQLVTKPLPAPSVVSIRQAELALFQFGILEQVKLAIANGADADKITWNRATEVRREDALVSNMATALGLSSADLDSLFTLAASL